MTTQQIDDYILDLDYDPRVVLSVQPAGSTEQLLDTTRETPGNAVIICTKKQVSLNKNLQGVAILRPTGGVIFPGALVYVDEHLRNGTPTPISFKQAPITLSVDLPGLQHMTSTVSSPSNSTVRTYINGVLEEWNKNVSSQGYVNAARSSIQITTSFSSQQVALDLGFNAEWADGSMSNQLGVNSSTQKSVAVAFVRQVFYSVTMDTPDSPGAVFADDVAIKRIEKAFSTTRVPGYVRSVDYGRILMITMETSEVDTKVNLKSALNQTLSGVKGGSSIDSNYEGIVKNASFSVVAIGGGATEAAQFKGSKEDLSKLGEYIENGATYRRDNPGAPVSYTVAFLKDNVLAEMGFTTNYTETEYVRYANGFVKVKHDGAYIARFKVTWHTPINGEEQWESGEKTLGFSKQIDIPGDATSVKIFAEAATGLVWDPWGEIMNVNLEGPDSKTYRVFGTTLKRRYEAIES